MSRPIRPGTIGKEATLAERIAWEREERGWSYERLATEMTAAGRPMSRDAIHRIEKGQPPRKVSVDELVALMGVFGLTFEELMTPLELVQQQRARAIAEELHDVTGELQATIRRMLSLFVEYNVLAQKSPELLEYINNHHRAANEGVDALFPVEVYGHLDKKGLDRVSVSATSIFNELMAVAGKAAKAEA